MLYAFIDGVAQHVLRNLDARVPIPLPSSTGHRGPAKLSNNIMGLVVLYNSAQELHELFEQAWQEEPGNSPNVQHAQDLMSYLHLWNQWRMMKNELMSLTIKAWRPPAWAVECNKQKKAALKEKGKARVTSNMNRSTTPGEFNPHNHSQISPAVPTTPVATGSISMAPTTTPCAPLEERITSVPAEDISAQERRHIPTPREALTTRQDIPPEAGPSNTNRAVGPSREPVGKPMPTGSSKAKGKTKPQGKDDFPANVPSLDASVEDWIKYIHHWHQHNDGALRAFPGVIRHCASK